MVNILDNAVKFSPEGGTVEVRLTEGVLTVRDHGPGVPEDELPHVFDAQGLAEGPAEGSPCPAYPPAYSAACLSGASAATDKLALDTLRAAVRTS
ncbi:hypothetical protein DV517_20600 [Streptomyces sp. S816]|nr:hypothetical protein DV517_20600 [Streptomyces sp. S816]